MSGAEAPAIDPSDCLFCRIIAGELPAEIIWETALTLAFRDIAPVAPTHVLIVSKQHLQDVAQLDESNGALLAEMISAAQGIAESEAVATSGYRLMFNVGEDALNTVAHLHMHVIGGRRLGWPPG